MEGFRGLLCEIYLCFWHLWLKMCENCSGGWFISWSLPVQIKYSFHLFTFGNTLDLCKSCTPKAGENCAVHKVLFTNEAIILLKGLLSSLKLLMQDENTIAMKRHFKYYKITTSSTGKTEYCVYHYKMQVLAHITWYVL